MEQHAPLPTTADVAELGRNLTDDGLALHEGALADLTAAIRSAGLATPAVDVLDDGDAAAIARLRAFGHLARRWDTLRAQIEAHRRFDASFDELRSAWLRHEELRRSAADVEQLWQSRTELDRLRLDTSRSRRLVSGTA